MKSGAASREHLIHLVDEVRNLRLHALDDSRPLGSLKRLLPETDVDNLCDSDYSSATIVDLCLGSKDTERRLSYDELLSVVKRILAGPQEKESDCMLLVELFANNCNHPAKTDLIFYPDEHFGGRSSPSAEEITQLAFAGSACRPHTPDSS
jgi:hypothetical protein